MSEGAYVFYEFVLVGLPILALALSLTSSRPCYGVAVFCYIIMSASALVFVFYATLNHIATTNASAWNPFSWFYVLYYLAWLIFPLMSMSPTTSLVRAHVLAVKVTGVALLFFFAAFLIALVGSIEHQLRLSVAFHGLFLSVVWLRVLHLRTVTEGARPPRPGEEIWIPPS